MCNTAYFTYQTHYDEGRGLNVTQIWKHGTKLTYGIDAWSTYTGIGLFAAWCSTNFVIWLCLRRQCFCTAWAALLNLDQKPHSYHCTQPSRKQGVAQGPAGTTHPNTGALVDANKLDTPNFACSCWRRRHQKQR